MKYEKSQYIEILPSVAFGSNGSFPTPTFFTSENLGFISGGGESLPLSPSPDSLESRSCSLKNNGDIKTCCIHIKV